mgnify:CR=1 FL=1
MSYLKRKKSSLESSILNVWTEAAKKTEGNKFGMALQQAKEKGEKTFTVAGKTYDVKTEKLVGGQKKLDKDKDGDIDGKDFAMLRKSKEKKEGAKPDFLDLDKDGNKKEPMKQAAKQAKAKKENYEIGTKERRDHTIETTPGQSKEDFEKQVEVMHKKKNSMREALAKMWGIEEKNNRNPFDNVKEKKYNGKKEGRTMTGKPETKVEVEPEVNEKKK